MNALEELKKKADDLAARALKVSGDRADRLFKKAGATYYEALSLDPEYYPALNGWAASLIAQARTKPGEEAHELFDLAEDKLHQAEVISPGSGSYNLACIAALRGRTQECRKWLEDGSILGRIPRRSRLESDPDMAAVRGEAWFRMFLEKIEE